MPTAASKALAVPSVQPILALYPLPTTDLGNGTGTLIEVASQVAHAGLGEGHPFAHALSVFVLIFVLGTLVGALLFGTYLGIASGCFGHLTNNAFGALGNEDFKGFLRCSIEGGRLTLRFVAADRVPRRWKGMVGDPPAQWRVIDTVEID